VKKRWSTRKILKTLWITFGVIFILWNGIAYQSRALPANILESDEDVRVRETSDEITFQAINTGGRPEVIFLQGALTDPKAYAPLCRALAERGFTCHLMKMPWRLPIRGYKKLNDLFDLNKKPYIIGGHSQGAKIAAQFVYENPHTLKGLFLLGTSHPRDIDLSNHDIPCIKVYAEHDGLASVHEVLENKDKLPQHATLTLIKGGNHSQFGYLGKLLADDDAEISREQQLHQTTEAVLNFLNTIHDSMGTVTSL